MSNSVNEEIMYNRV